MIKKIITVPRMQIEYWINNKARPLDGMAWALISIYAEKDIMTSENMGILMSMGCKKIMSENFHDLSNVQYAMSIGMKDNQGRPITFFDNIKAKNIIHFIDEINHMEVDCLVINCMAGVSRSGAIGLFACRYLELNEADFREDNPHIFPNPLVLDILNKESGLNDDYVKTWIMKDSEKTRDRLESFIF